MENGSVDIGSFSPFAYVGRGAWGRFGSRQSINRSSATYRGLIVHAQRQRLKTIAD